MAKNRRYGIPSNLFHNKKFLKIVAFSVLASTLIASAAFTQTAFAASTLTVKGMTLDGKSMNMWTTVAAGGATVKSGFTPLSFAGTTGSTYAITVSDYGSIYFDHWENGSTARTRTLALNSDVTITAFFRTTSTHNLTVNSAGLSGNALPGYYTVISSGGTVVKTGFTSLSFVGSHGATYAVSVSDYGSMTFDHWGDGSTARAKTLTLNADTALTAYYRSTLPPDNNPVGMDDSAAANQSHSLLVNVLANDSDPDGDALKVTAVSAPSHGSATVNANSTVTYAPTPGYVGQDSFTYTISDGRGGTATATVAIQVNPVGSPPVASDQSASTNEDVPVQITLAATDADGDSLTYSMVTNPAHGSLAGSADARTYTPSANYNGPDSFTFKANDGIVDSSIATVSITVLPVNDSPVAGNDSITTNQNTAAIINVLANDSDPDGDALSVTSVSAPTYGSATVNSDNTITYTPPSGFSGTDSFSYTISDGNGGTAGGTVNVAVKAPPTAYVLAIGSSDMYGKATNGLYTTIKQGSTTVKTGFTPVSYTGTSGTTYSVAVSDYGSSFFDHWDDGSTARTRAVTLNSDRSVTALFRVPTLAINPTSGVVGTSITATGTYFSPNSAAAITYGGAQVASATSSASGSFTATFVAPLSGTGQYLVQATDGKGWKASASFQDTSQPKAYSMNNLLPKTGVYVPLYMYPSGTGATWWQQVIDTKNAHPSVPIVATFNPSSGPGTSQDSNVAGWVAKLRSSGVVVLGYTHDSYGARSLTDLKADADKYKNWYNADGLFIDEFTNKVGYETHYSSITSYVKSIGMKMTFGNPGTDVPKSYVGTVDVINITEGSGYMPISWLQYCVLCTSDQGWHYQYDKRYFAYMRYGISSLDTAFETDSSQWVGLLYLTDGTDSNGRWFSLPSYFGTMVATLDK